jgi:hypothetical protein
VAHLTLGSFLFSVESHVVLLALLDIAEKVRTRLTLCLIQRHIMKTFRHSVTSAQDVNGRYIYISMVQQPLVGKGLLIMEALRSYSETPQSVGLLWTCDQSVVDTST